MGERAAGKRCAVPGFAVAGLVVLLLGGLLRVQPWRQATPAGTPPAPGSQPAGFVTPVAPPSPVSDGPRQAVLDFYALLDRGAYEAAYDLCLESQWQAVDGGYVHMGLTPRQTFIGTLEHDWATNGQNLTIVAIQVLGSQALPMPAGPMLDPPEYASLSYLPPDLRLTSLVQVDVGGTFTETCTPWSWQKRMLVAGLSDGRWRLLLSGGPRPGSTHRYEWFTDTDPFEGRPRLPAAAGN